MAPSIRAEVRYLAEAWRHCDGRAFIHSRESRHLNTIKCEVDIRDGREAVAGGAVAIRTNGMTFERHAPSVTDYLDDAEVKAAYHREIIPMLKDATGATEVFVSGHQVRTENPETFLGAYSRYVHCDYPLHPMPMRERALLERSGSNLAGELVDDSSAGRRHYAWFNIWEAIERPATQNQLCVVDGASVGGDDFREYHFTDKPDGGYATMPLAGPGHRFYCFADMEPGEAILFKQYDSRKDHPLACPHTSFFDSSKGPDALGRRSVEYRALCVF